MRTVSAIVIMKTSGLEEERDSENEGSAWCVWKLKQGSALDQRRSATSSDSLNNGSFHDQVIVILNIEQVS